MAKQDLFESALASEGVTGKLAEVARSIYMQESSGGKNTRTSNAGAMGGMQIVPGTFASVADKGWDISNPEHNARAGIRYLKQLDKMSGGDPALTAAGYYGGPGGMEKAKRGVAVSDPRNPNAPTTLEYGQQVAARLKSGQAAEAIPVQLAQVEGRVLPEQANPVVPVDAPVDPTWEQFQAQMPRPIQATDLAYGEMVSPVPTVTAPQMDPRMYAPKRVDPNFTAFSRWKGVA